MKENYIAENGPGGGITFSNLFFLIKKNIILILAITFIFTLCGSIYGLGFKKTIYKATATAIVIVNDNPQQSLLKNQFNYSTSLNLINTFKDFLTSDFILTKTCEELKSEEKIFIDERELKEAITVNVSTSSLLLTVQSTTEDEQMAIIYVNAILKCAIDTADNEFMTQDGIMPLSNKLIALDYAVRANGTKGLTLVLMLSFVLGLAVSFALVIVRYLLDDTYKSKEDFEKDTGIITLTLVPDMRSFEKKQQEA